MTNTLTAENAMLKAREIFDEILRDKRALLDFANPREFIFSHSALGVGWDNPNIFNIATLNESYSDVKKRQELGRGLRICRNQDGQRIYDPEDVKEGERQTTPLTTIVPNETYETFAAQYQEQIKEIYGTSAAGSTLRKKHKGVDAKNKLTRTRHFESHMRSRRSGKSLPARPITRSPFDEDEDRSNVPLKRSTNSSIGDYEAEIVLKPASKSHCPHRQIAITSDEIGRETEKPPCKLHAT